MKRELKEVYQIATVFIGTIVGAGLASGKEITQFFTSYGYKSFMGILICGIVYIFIGSLISDISLKYNLKSYNDLIRTVSPGFLGMVTDIVTGFFLLSGSSIILAGSGALIHQYFGISNWIGTILMVILSILILLKDTDGLIKINSFIVPSLVTVIVITFLLYILFYSNYKTIVYDLKMVSFEKRPWIISCLLYCGFNLLSCSGVLVPLSREIKNKSSMRRGILLGSIVLTVLCLFLNIMLMLNKPYIYQYEIPLLYIANRFGKPLQIMILIIIWFEMFSTEVSNIYSISKTLEQKFNIPFNNCIFLVMLIAIPISKIGFSKLITILYPAFGVISLIFIGQLIYFSIKPIKLKKY
ncbi:transporter [Clostridium algidicarnis]|uniref:Putative membrane protein YkvI n=1 Tax=Clostridium algidicarnis DSM 15099 TaxID=1121295 RepID=A0A2S6FYY0_9CLOT|nr:transporter [Clostridium algidicarnis]PPK48781.1 putative membrane protein YkvI [Clostridium algidicarnis DSM 15099]